MYLTSESNPSRSIPFEMDPMTTAPSSADQTEPRPPKRLVPAITGPAIASSRMSPEPEAWLTAINLDAARIPPAAAIIEAIVKTAIRTRLIGIPARRAASAFPPTAKMCRPNRVLVVTHAKKAQKATRIRADSGIPRSETRIETAMKVAAPTMTVRITIPASGSVSNLAF